MHQMFTTYWLSLTPRPSKGGVILANAAYRHSLPSCSGADRLVVGCHQSCSGVQPLRAWHLMQDRHFAMLLGRCIEEAAVLKVESHSSAQGDFSVSGGVTGRSLSCKVSHCLAGGLPDISIPSTFSLLTTWTEDLDLALGFALRCS